MDAREVRSMFSSLAPEYDRFNRWSSLGLDAIWRRSLARIAGQGRYVLDIGAGTGKLTRLLARRNPSSVVIGVDSAAEMVRHAALDPSSVCLSAAAERLPFTSECFDAVVSAFVLRNLQRAGVLLPALRETCRVLKPGCGVAFLDLTRPESSLLRWVHRLYLGTVVAGLGRALFRERWPGSYLDDTIESLLPREQMRVVFEDAGFCSFAVRPLWGGLVSIFSGMKTC